MQILNYINQLFTDEVLNGEECPIELHLKDNLPTIQMGRFGARRPATCDFCKELHDSMQDFCELEVLGLDCTQEEIQKRVTLQNVID